MRNNYIGEVFGARRLPQEGLWAAERQATDLPAGVSGPRNLFVFPYSAYGGNESFRGELGNRANVQNLNQNLKKYTFPARRNARSDYNNLVYPELV